LELHSQKCILRDDKNTAKEIDFGGIFSS
jgi:hypothetical protein